MARQRRRKGVQHKQHKRESAIAEWRKERKKFNDDLARKQAIRRAEMLHEAEAHNRRLQALKLQKDSENAGTPQPPEIYRQDLL